MMKNKWNPAGGFQPSKLSETQLMLRMILPEEVE